MSYSIIPTGRFKKEFKRLVKKFPSLKRELQDLGSYLQNNPKAGAPLGKNIFKIRVSIKSKGKGKSGGARVITYVINETSEVYLLTIYDKSEMNNIDDKTLEQIIKSL